MCYPSRRAKRWSPHLQEIASKATFLILTPSGLQKFEFHKLGFVDHKYPLQMIPNKKTFEQRIRRYDLLKMKREKLNRKKNSIQPKSFSRCEN